MKIAIAQINPTVGDLTGNAQKILAAAQAAAAQGAELLLTPELALCGYPPRDLLLDPSFIDAIASTLQQLAQTLPPQLAVLVGYVERNAQAYISGGKPLFNSVALLSQGQIQQTFHKRLLPTYDVFDENRYFEPGLETKSFTIAPSTSKAVPCPSESESESASPSTSPCPSESASLSLKIGVTICEDLWNDEEFWGKRHYAISPLTDLVDSGVDLIVNLSASPYSVQKQKTREAMLSHAANRHHLPILYANQIAANDDLIFDGCSVGFDRSGNLVCRAPAFETDLLVVEFNQEKRDLQPSLIATMPENGDAEIWQALVLGVKDYTRKCGFSKVVIGLSGGIDSALVAAIATAALGQENVLGVLMPSPYSSEHSVQDALQLAANLGIQTQTLAIGGLMQGYDESLAPLFAGTEFGLAEENLQSRIRGNLLMAISNKFGHLLLSTGNKSEMAVGYCTLYGDMNGGLAVIADVPKTRVYSLCRWLNQTTHLLIPENILNKAPSAELKPGQVDQDSLPPYDALDDILERLICDRESASQIAAAGHDPTVVDRVIKMVARAEFKRRQAPPGLKVTDRAFGTGWRMPVANKWLFVSNYTMFNSTTAEARDRNPTQPD